MIVEPPSATPAGASASVMLTVSSKVVARLPYASSAETVSPNAMPAIMVAGGGTVTTSRAAGAGVTLMGLAVTVSPPSLAWRL